MTSGIASFIAGKGRDFLFPLEAADIRLTDFCQMQVQGLCNSMYIFSTSYRLRNRLFEKDFALKIGRGNAEGRMAREYRALKALKANGIPVPTAIALELDRSIIGSPFMIMEKINGASTSNFMSNKKNTLAIIDMLAKLLALLHTVDPYILFPNDLSENTLGQAVKFRESVSSELRDKINIGYITSLSPLTRRKYLRAIRKLERVEIHRSPMALIHADFGPDHVLLSDKGPVITDWEGIRMGDPAYDLGWLYHVTRLEGQIFIDHRFVRASKETTLDLDTGDESVRCYEKYTGSIPENLEFYKNLAALKLAVTLDLHVRFGYAAFSRILRLRPKEIFSQTVFAYSDIRSFKKNCEFFLRERDIL